MIKITQDNNIHYLGKYKLDGELKNVEIIDTELNITTWSDEDRSIAVYSFDFINHEEVVSFTENKLNKNILYNVGI
jgi:hypothetical protein